MIRRHFLTTALLGLTLGPRAVATALQQRTALSIYVIGDWGTGGSLQRKVASGMAHRARKLGESPAIILSTGDNIYPNGVTSVEDPQWTSKFTSVYGVHDTINVPWWAILGNHDHRGDVDAQIAYSKRNPKWHMPGRTWSTTLPVTSSTSLGITGIDTTPLLQKKDGWKQQLQWLDETLAASSATVKIVTGHHPMRSYGHYGDSAFLITHVKPLLDKHKVRLYASGHDHDLQAIKHPSDAFSCLISGAGGGTRPSKRGEHTKAFLEGGGFADLRVTATGEMAITICDADGNNRETMKL
jgi:acid phosphatase